MLEGHRMIIDRSTNQATYTHLNRNMEIIFDYIKNNNLAELSKGVHEIDGEHLYVVIQNYETKEESKGVWEAHQRYLDFHYLISGAEKIGYAPIDKMKESAMYNEKDDFALYTGEGNFVELSEGMFAIFYPQDVHMTSIQINGPQKVKKAVFKVLI